MSIPGKIAYIKNGSLAIAISAGTMIDQHEWVPSSDHYRRFGDQYPLPYQDLRVQVKLDNAVLIDNNLSQPINTEHLFEDSETVTEHAITITLSGVDDSHQVNLKNIGNLSPMMRIEGIWIEQLSMRLVLEDYGQCFYTGSNDLHVPSEFVGQSGTQILKFSTPIYPWLLSMQRKPTYFY